jgi:AMMECR1 domain-containing protein
MSITTKLKKCAGCNELKHIWKSHGKDKYCQPCWYSIEKPKSISPVSKKRQVEMDEYSKKRLAFLALHVTCQAKLVGCTGSSSDVHHSKGRIGDNYLNMSTWVALCRSCHSYIEQHPEEAKELGFSQSRLN